MIMMRTTCIRWKIWVLTRLKKNDWPKRALKYESSYMIENRNGMIYIHNKKVKNISECNLLNDIFNPTQHAKNINSHWYPILHGFMNTRKGRAKFKKLRILLGIGCSSTILMGRLVGKLNPE